MVLEREKLPAFAAGAAAAEPVSAAIFVGLRRGKPLPAGCQRVFTSHKPAMA
jgi:hypothetical protein